MSEFSESYHLRSSDLNQARKLIKATSNPGFIAKSSEEWVSLVPHSAICSFETDPDIIKNNTGVLLHYTNAEDHMFGFRVFSSDRLVSEYECNINGLIDDDMSSTITKKNLNCSEIINMFELDISEFELMKLLTPKSVSEYFLLADKFMEILRIPPKYFSWVSYDYCEMSQEQEDSHFTLIKD